MPWMHLQKRQLCQNVESLDKLGKIMRCIYPSEKCPLDQKGLEKSCPRFQFCQRTIFDFDEEEKTGQSGSLKIAIQHDYVVHVKDFVSYDWQSFIGEVGGTLGLLLGISFAHIYDFLVQMINWVMEKLCWFHHFLFLVAAVSEVKLDCHDLKWKQKIMKFLKFLFKITSGHFHHNNHIFPGKIRSISRIFVLNCISWGSRNFLWL